MTQTIQRKDSAQDVSVPQSADNPATDVSRPTSRHSSAELASDNEASEKPVREKLKKASIASIPRNAQAHSGIDVPSEPDRAVIQTEPITPYKDHSSSGNGTDNVNGYRGRPIKKRSFDDLERGDEENTSPPQPIDRDAIPQVRKRSRGVRRGQGFEVEDQPEDRSGTPLYERQGQEKSMDEMSEPDDTYLMQNIQNVAPISDPDPEDLEMRDSALSPRKKRSRDHLDPDTDREQKIVATEEAKAQRRSEENERDEILLKADSTVSPQNSTGIEQPSNFNESSGGTEHDISTKNPLEVNPSHMNYAELSPSKPPSHPHQSDPHQTPQTSPDAFAASGFAALSGSSTSPFGTIGTTSKTAQANAFSPALFQAKHEASPFSRLQEKPMDPVENQKSFATTTSGLLSFENSGVSGFAISGGSKLGSFGGSTFGSGFGTAFGGGNKLSTFAAPVGDAKWGGDSGVGKSFAAPSKDEEGEGNSDSEDEGETGNEEETSDVDGRFQQQDVGTGEDGEKSIFSSPRVNLYCWNGSAWKEGGRGTFKLNVTLPDADGGDEFQKTGRFIMRAHQTFRVILNTPIFQQMKIGDSKGNEPTGKSLSFSVIENGKPTPYLIKMSDEGECKTLYHEVRKLQQAL